MKRETNEGETDRSSRGWDDRERTQSERWRRERKEREEGRKTEGKGRKGERRKDRIKEGGTDALAQGLALSQLMSGWAQEACVAGRG